MRWLCGCAALAAAFTLRSGVEPPSGCEPSAISHSNGPSTARSGEWPAWVSTSRFWRALAKGTAWAGFVALFRPSRGSLPAIWRQVEKTTTGRCKSQSPSETTPRARRGAGAHGLRAVCLRSIVRGLFGRGKIMLPGGALSQQGPSQGAPQPRVRPCGEDVAATACRPAHESHSRFATSFGPQPPAPRSTPRCRNRRHRRLWLICRCRRNTSAPLFDRHDARSSFVPRVSRFSTCQRQS